MCWAGPIRDTREKGGDIAAVSATLAAGGSVWFGDETTLRAGWAQRGEQAVVTIIGRNARRVVHGTLNIVTGEPVRVVRERNRDADSAAFVAALAARTSAGASVLVWDNAPPHHTRLARETAEATGIASLPCPSGCRS